LQGSEQQSKLDVEIGSTLQRLNLVRFAFAKAPMRSREEREIQKLGQKLIVGAELVDEAFQEHCQHVAAPPPHGPPSRNMIEAVESGRASKRASLRPTFSVEIGRVPVRVTPQLVPA
jgi:hypothetical protein